MMRLIGWFPSLLRQNLVLLVFGVLAIFTYVYFFRIPYAGFDFTNGQLFAVYTTTPNTDLQIGDQLIQIGPIRWDDFADDWRQTLFDGVEPGQVVPLIIQRDGEVMTIPWVFPGFNQSELLDRLYSAWWLPYAFWFAGAVTYLFIRPRDTRWQLLVAFNFLTALWLSVGSGPSHWHIWGSSVILKVAIWLCVPVYWHLHWIFPKPLGRLPEPIWWGAYLAGGTLALLELFQILPANLHLLGFILAIAGSLALLIAHAIWQPEQHGPIRLLLKVSVLVILPSIAVGTLGLLGGDLRFASLVLLGLPLIPGAYIYAIYRHQLGKLELRANRLITLYLYLLITGSTVVILSAVATRLLNFSGVSILFSLVTAVLIGFVTATKFSFFERFVEQRILGMSLPPASLLESYAIQIVTKLDKASLATLLKDQVLPSLLVRQSAIIYWEENQPIAVLFTLGVIREDLPAPDEIPALLAQAGTYRPLRAEGSSAQPYPWVRLSLSLNLSGKLMGLWLLGRRDPDDLYAQREIPTLQALAAQTAVALTNILRSDNLHKLYQANIDRYESERNHLALELHDDVLNQIALLTIYIDEENVAPQFFKVFEELTMHFRQTIRGLRPAMLDYGLQAALYELVDQLAERVGDEVDLQFEVPSSAVRHPINVEQHIFRIVQQAAENALQHASPKTVRILGCLDSEKIHLIVEDDGVGFPAGDELDLSTLLARRHFGLVGMYERAALISAQMKLDSTLGQGTCVTIHWHANGLD